MLTQSQVQDSRRVGRQVPDPDLTHKTHHQKERRVSHQKRKTDKTSLPPRARKHKPYTREENHTPKRKKKNHTTHSRLTSQHHPATPADTDPHPIPPTYFLPTSLPSPIHPIRIPSTRLLTPCYHPLTTYCPLLLHHHLCLYYMPLPYHRLPAPCPQLHLCLSRSRYRSPSTCVPLPVGRYVTHHRLATICSLVYCYSATAICILFTCLSALLCSPCYSTPTTVLGSAPVLTTLHHSHLLCVTPVTCATTSPLRESTHTPCRFHHPYRSLTLAHRVVPPLVVPVPSLAVSGVRLSLVVPLAGESPLADARLRLTPMVTCCSLTLAHTLPSIHALSLPAPPCTHTCSHSFQHSC